MPKIADLNKQEKFIKLRAQGLSFEKISKQMKISKQTLVNWSKDLQEEIANRRAMELEALQEEYYLSTEARIKAFGEQVEAIKKELSQRDLSEVPTEKLLTLFMQYMQALKTEHTEPVFKSERELQEARGERSFLETISSL